MSMKPGDPEIATINALIDHKVGELNQFLWHAKRQAGELPDIYVQGITSREPGGRTDSTYMNLDQLIRNLKFCQQLQDEINFLVRTKLALFDDVDFQGGGEWRKAINKHRTKKEK